MKYFIQSLAVSVLMVSGGGCSKKEATSTAQPAAPVETPAPQSATASPAAVPAANAAQLENNVSAALKQQNYDAAVDAILQVQSASVNMSDDQRRQYAQQLRNTSTALQAAAVTDPKARAAYDRMSRAVLGR